MGYLLTLSDSWLFSDLYLCTLAPQVGTTRYLVTNRVKHATTSSLILFNSSRRVDSNKLPPELIQPLVIERSLLLYFGSPAGTSR